MMLAGPKTPARLLILGLAALAAAAGAVHADTITAGAASEGIRTTQIDRGTSQETTTLATGPLANLSLLEESRYDPIVLKDSAVVFSLGGLAAFPQGVVVTDATLYLTISLNAGTAGNPPAIQVGGFGDANGVVDLADFGQPAVDIGTQGPFPTGSVGTVLAFSGAALVDLIQSLADAKGGYVGFQLLRSGSVNGFLDLYGSAAADPATRPRLEITFAAVPEPSSVALIATGLVGAAAFARRRRQG